MEQPHHALKQKEAITFTIVSSVGAAALVLGLVLIISANYHERAYLFLILGAGGFMGGLAGVIVGGQKVRAVLDYGLIAMGFVGMVVGFNYLISQYGPEPNLAHGYLVISVSTIAILIGVIGELIAQSKNGFAGIWSVFSAGSDRVNRYCDVNRWHRLSGCTATPQPRLCFACARIGLSGRGDCRWDSCSTESANHSQVE